MCKKKHVVQALSDAQKTPISLFDGGIAYLIAAVALCALQFLLRGLYALGIFDMNAMDAVGNVFSVLYYVAALGLPFAFFAARRSHPIESLRLNPISVGRAIGIALLAVFAFMLVNTVSIYYYAFVEMSGGVIYDAGYEIPDSTIGIIGMFFLIVALPAVFEECLFRGVLLNATESRGGKTAVVVTTLLFSLLHGSLLGLPSEWIGGTIMALLVLRLGSIYASVIYHTVFNGVAFAIMVYMRDLKVVNMSMLDQIGGTTGLMQLVPTLVIFSLLVFFQYRLCVRGTRSVDQIVPRETKPVDWQTIVVFASAIFTCLYFLVQDCILIYGG